MTTTLTTTTLKTVTLEFVTAPIIRSVARKDIPEYGLTEGQVFYMAYSATESKAQGKSVYHIVTWDYEKIGWNCPCKATTSRCKHNKAVAKDCAKSHTVQGYKPSTKADTFAALVARYDVRSIEVIEEAANYTFRQPVDPSPVRRYFTQAEIEAGLPEQVAQARRATAQREAQLRATASLNGNRSFSFMR